MTERDILADARQDSMDAQILLGRITTELRYAGPIPPPSLLKQFEEIVPGSAKQIINNSLHESRHRRSMDRLVRAGDNSRANIGVWTGAVLTGLSILGGIGLAASGTPAAAAAGATIATGSVVGLAGVFVYGTRARRQEREHKAEIREKMRSASHKDLSVAEPPKPDS